MGVRFGVLGRGKDAGGAGKGSAATRDAWRTEIGMRVNLDAYQELILPGTWAQVIWNPVSDWESSV